MERRDLPRQHPRCAAILKPLLLSLQVILFLVPNGSASAADSSARKSGGAADVDSLQEANRILEEEIKLASGPQVYILLNLPERTIQIKSRGIELHRLEILAWHVSGTGSLAGVHRLRARPEVSRPRTAPDSSLDPIGLEDMPGEYALEFESGLLLTVAPPAREQPWLWMRNRLRVWWIHVVSSPGSIVHVTLPQDAARSLAWSVTDGMPFLISRVPAP
jgi:hypothetical protein